MDRLHEIAQFDAVRLLLDRARLVRPGLELDKASLAGVSRICSSVQGMPLALVLAAGWLEMLTFEEVADEITTSLDILEVGGFDESLSISEDFDLWLRIARGHRFGFVDRPLTFYRNLGVTYNPETHDELIQLLHAQLEPKPMDPTLAYGYFWPTFGIPFKHFEPDGYFSGRFHGVRIRPSPTAQARITLLRLTHPQRFVRHVKRGVTKRWRYFRNRIRRPV